MTEMTAVETAAVETARQIRQRERKYRAGVASRRLWGYIFWGSMGLVVAVPEISAAFWPEYVPWPTISGIVGYLEYWHPWVALIVVSVIAWWALHIIEFGPEKAAVFGVDLEENRKRRYVNTPGGWNTRAKELKEFERPAATALGYMGIAAIGVLAPSLFVSLIWRPDDEFLLGEVLYSAIFIFWILIPLIMAYVGRDIPFPTLFETFRDFAHVDRIKIFATLIAGGIVALLIHLVLYPWPTLIPDLKDLHEQNKQQNHQEKKENEPPAFGL